MYSPVLSVPARRVSGWVAEVDPKYARAWLAALPLANSAEAAREIYQALYTINRAELKVQARLELMALYSPVVATVCNGLQSHLLHAVAPLGPKKRQLAEFIRRLHIEMAYGYKCCLRDLSRTRVLLRRKSRSVACIERALYHQSEVLLRSYVVYLPYPAAVWRENHELYRLAESLGAADEVIDTAGEGAGAITINERYVQTLLLGLTNPYQLPQNAAQQLHALLGKWAIQARIEPATLRVKDAAGCFLVDLTADAPPVPHTGKGQDPDGNKRVLNASALLHTLHRFVTRLEAGEPVERLGLGVDCLDSTCIDLLRRMTRALGEVARRRYTRRQRSASVFVCVGLNAINFFTNGQRHFAAPNDTLAWFAAAGGTAEQEAAFVELDGDNARAEDPRPPPPPAAAAATGTESYHVDRWQLRDIGPLGMSIARYGDAVTPVRVGELIGVQQPNDFGRWRPAVIRWVKSPETNSVEIGIEVLAASITPVAVRTPSHPAGCPGLRLPGAEVMHRPATLLLPRGVCQIGDEVELLEDEAGPRRVRVLRLLERTGAFEQVIFADSARG